LINGKPQVLIIDDDPSHLRIYGWILEAADFHSIPALVVGDSLDLPANQPVDIIVLNYRLSGVLTAVEVAVKVRQLFPDSPIIVLSDLFGMPDDIASFAQAFVRKGQPEMLIATIRLMTHREPLEK
jgi:DNA-binding response OmpR family regulator